MNEIETPCERQTRARLSAWQLIKPYWVSEERRSAWALLAAIIAMNLTIVVFTVLLNSWNGTFFDALQAKDVQAFPKLLAIFAGYAFAAIVLTVYSQYLRQMLGFRWRQWLTRQYTQQWLSGRAFYRIERDGLVDNPDQRIANDLQSLASNTLALSLDLLSTLVRLASFVTILWTLSGTLTVSLFDARLPVPGYMVWAAALYALAGSFIVQKVGRPLVGINYRQERVEADFRFGLIRVRENAEQIAFYDGGETETANAKTAFQHIRENWWLIMKFTRRMTFVTSFYAQIAIVFPIMVAAPRYFAGAISFGAIMRISNAFGTVSDSFSWFINSYRSLVEWRATINRLRDFKYAMDFAHASGATAETGITVNETPGRMLVTRGVALARPDGAPLSCVSDVSIEPGSRWLVSGPSGSGKSTLMRALAGLWPFGDGRIDLPAGVRRMFVPQTSYLPIGTLRGALAYPSAEGHFTDDASRHVLIACNLGAYADRLDESGHWSRRLSPGEQQRLAVARVLLHEPDFIFLDEATSALDASNELLVYNVLIDRLPKAAIVSVAHRADVAQFHDERIVIVPHGEQVQEPALA
jgi:vitamin B12/bleomycin/antimicrobial peptide transport system ATP-binding/permease protein